mmetsp:Transcript_23144/g.55829  ORF Transcript_23144/g.55829 Transcript_23144/m.55829 type:complete len:88 (-) Transcript_23144:810-1073(-)
MLQDVFRLTDKYIIVSLIFNDCPYASSISWQQLQPFQISSPVDISTIIPLFVSIITPRILKVVMSLPIRLIRQVLHASYRLFLCRIP